MRGKKSDLGRNDIKNWEIRSFWGRFSLKWGYFGQYTKLPARCLFAMAAINIFYYLYSSLLVKIIIGIG
jgi:hypothetical protein